MRKMILLAGLVLALGAFLPGSARPATGGSDLPLKGTASGYFTLNLLTGQTHIVGTSGQLTHLGLWTSVQDQQLIPTGGCVNPPVGADFYPIFTTGTSGGGCVWQLGGTHIPGTTNTFGGTSATEYGTDPLALFYPAPNGGPQYIYEDFRNIQPNNPCPG